MYYGWKIVGVTFLTNFISVGFIFYSYGVFFKTLAEEFGGSRLGVALGLTWMNIVVGCFAPFLGRIVDQGVVRKMRLFGVVLSIRNIMCFGAVLMGLGFFAVSRITALWQFYLVFVTLLGFGQAMVGMNASSTLVSNWFMARRGFALGIATMGISLSGVVMAPLATKLIAEIGWRSSFLVYGFTALLVVLPIAWRYVVNRPEDMGLLPDGAGKLEGFVEGEDEAGELANGEASSFAPPPEDENVVSTIMSNPNFWFISLAISLNFCANGAMLTHLVPYGTDLGFSPRDAAYFLSMCAAFGVVGKVLFGWVTDNVGKRISMWFSTGLQLAGLILIIRVGANYKLLLGACGVFGLGMGGLVPIWGSLVGSTFGRNHFGRVMGLMAPVMIPVQSLGIPYAAFVFDRTGTYDIAFRTFVVVYALAMAAIFLVRMPSVEPGAEGRMAQAA